MSPRPEDPTHNREIPVTLHPSGFDKSDSNFYSLTVASDGNVYYTLCSHNVDTHARVYRYTPQSGDLRRLGDFGEITGQAGRKVIPQGKSHSKFLELDGTLYIATHFGFYAPDAGRKEAPGTPPPGYARYPGGHIIAYDLARETFADLAKAPEGEGILTFEIDRVRRRLYGLTWPSGLFLCQNLDTGDLRNFGKVSRDGELGTGDQYQCLCRSFAVVPDTGMVYFTNATGEIRRYDPESEVVTTLEHETLKRDILGAWDPHEPGHQGYNWRTVLWHPTRRVFFGVHPRSGYLFQFNPADERLELIERICAAEHRRSGQFEPFRYGYLALALGNDNDTLYYLTCVEGLVADDGRRVETAAHLVTYSLSAGRYLDHGVLRLADGRYVSNPQTLGIHPDGTLYSCPWIEKSDRAEGDPAKCQVDLISFENPLRKGAHEPIESADR